MLPIKYLTIHCAATKENANVSEATIKRIGYERFNQPSYHLVIERDGSYHRHIPDSKIGAHTGGRNTGNIGICYVGGLDNSGRAKDTRTLAQKETLRTLIRTYQERYPDIHVLGHRDWPGVKKDCPCFDVRKWVAEGMPI